MIVFRPDRVQLDGPTRFPLALLSDLHIGSRATDYDRLNADLKEARRRNARISINGDIFDFILPSDKKRFRMSDVPDRLFKAGDNMVGAAIDWAVEILEPYADLIDVIGEGNHDDSVTKYHSNNAVTQLIGILNHRNKTNIQFGGYCGWLQYRFAIHETQRYSYKIQYHHGAGGGSPVTKGTIAFSRASSWLEGADAIWRGHTHHRNVNRSVVQRLDDYGNIRHRDVLEIRSASYLWAYQQQDPTDALAHGRRTNYAALLDVAPQPHGGIFLTLDVGYDGITAIAEV